MQTKGASFILSWVSVGLPMGGFIFARTISYGPIFYHGQLFHHKNLVMQCAPRPIRCHLETNSTGKTNRVKKINPKTYNTFNNCSAGKSFLDKTSFLVNLEVIV